METSECSEIWTNSDQSYFFSSQILIKIPCMHFSVNVVHNNCIIEEESCSINFQSSEMIFFAFEFFVKSSRRSPFNRSICFGGSVSSLVFFKFHFLMSYIAGVNQFLAFEEAKPSIPWVQCQMKEVSIFPIPKDGVEVIQFYCFPCSIDSEKVLNTALPTRFRR